MKADIKYTCNVFSLICSFYFVFCAFLINDRPQRETVNFVSGKKAERSIDCRGKTKLTVSVGVSH